MSDLSRPGRRRLMIYQRFVLSNAVAVVLLLAAVVISAWQINRLAGALDAFQLARQRATTALRVHQASTELLAIVSQLLLVENASAFETGVAQALEHLKECHAELALLTAGAAPGEAAQPLMQRVDLRLQSVIGVADMMVRQASAGKWPSVRVRLGVLNRDHQQLALETNELVQLALDMEKSAAAQVDSARLAAMLYPALSLLLGASLAAILMGRVRLSITRPIGQLIEGATHLAVGSLDTRVTVDGPAELDQLATAFNQMADRLQASHAELEQRVAERTHELVQERNMLEATSSTAGSRRAWSWAFRFWIFDRRSRMCKVWRGPPSEIRNPRSEI